MLLNPWYAIRMSISKKIWFQNIFDFKKKKIEIELLVYPIYISIEFKCQFRKKNNFRN